MTPPLKFFKKATLHNILAVLMYEVEFLEVAMNVESNLSKKGK
jgi:hypothetical protein